MSESGSGDRVAVYTNGHRSPLSAEASEPAAATTVEAVDTPDDPGLPRLNVKVNPIQAILGVLVFAWGVRLLLGRLRRGG